MDNKELLTKLGQNLRKYRVAAGMTQEELSNLSGLDRNYIGGIERGQKNVSILTLTRILGNLKIDIKAFFREL